MKLSQILEQDIGYNEDLKKQFHLKARTLLRKVAKAMNTEYDLRSCLGGIAVSGEVILHTPYVYVQVGQSSLGPGHAVLYRRCNGMKDYAGGPNQFTSVRQVEDDPQAFAKFLNEAFL